MVEAETGASDAGTGRKQYKSRVAQEQREPDLNRRHKGKRKNRSWRSESWIQAQRGQLKMVREPLGGRGVGHDSWELGKSRSVEFMMGQETFHP